MNPYRPRTPSVSGVAVALVVLLAIGAIVASIVLGPKPNTTVVNLQPVRPVQPAAAATVEPQPSADPVASIPAEELPVVESRPTQPAPDRVASDRAASDRVIEGSELGMESPAQAATPDTAAASSATPTTSSSRASSVQASGTTSARTATDAPTRTRATPTATPTSTMTSRQPATQTSAPSAFLRRNTNGVSVQVGAFRNVDSAAKLAQDLARKGFTASVQPSGGLYRVVIGPYKDDATARAAAARAR